ncbi:AAA family ATPase [Herbidospora sp. NEAU-GS84]|uniref:AAA family ATPase n=1 Tax=Herbidospora solisilvae TaxID=2696284 RepID=A0A7C9NEQ7_9ACTN|nr:AAA domain-containing protein [Herbidospora solisilvae]NAS20432.1 AAA family ATPase [Herbidospora solisilvae]
MTRTFVELGPEVGLVWSQNLPTKIFKQRERYPMLPDLNGIARDLWELAAQPIPARLERGRQGRGDFLKIYIDGRYGLSLNETKDKRGYWVGGIHPMHFDDHDKIARGGLLVRAGRWSVYDHPNDLRAASGWDWIEKAWRTEIEGRAGDDPGMPGPHSQFLDRLETLVEEGRRIELSGKGSARLSAYRSVNSVAALRKSARSVHSFQLVGRSRLNVGARVHIEGEPDLRGRVAEIEEDLATIRFERPVDFGRIPQMGSFVESPNTLQFDKQAEAIAMVRRGESRNPRLLTALVDRRFQPFEPDSHCEPAEPLDDSQRAAFAKALTVPDLAVIQGPPGTGKTRTIRQLVRGCADQGQKVLVTSYTNRGVDNVLKELPSDLLILRIGEGVTADCDHLTLEARAVELQQRIRERTEPKLTRYAVADPETGTGDALLRQLLNDLDGISAAAEQARRSAATLARHDAVITLDRRSRLAEMEDLGNRYRQEFAEIDSRHRALGQAEARAARAGQWPVVGALFRRRAERVRGEQSEVAAGLERIRRTLQTIDRDRRSVQEEIATLRAGHPELLRLRKRHDEHVARHQVLVGKTAEVAEALGMQLADVAPLPPVTADEAALVAFARAAQDCLALMRRRLDLLTRWRGALERRTEQLYAELVRYADVIGATCIGVATAGHLGDVGFDLVVADEAGQIATQDLLVPLVRARRAVLVGDHVQLPPLEDRELLAWVRRERPDDPTLAHLVTQSAFELLFPYVPAGHREVLRYQRRMPEMLARFISRQFYGGFLVTDVDRPHRDELFAAPMAFVDTSAVAASRRRERRPRPDEPWPQKSTLNDLEAAILTELACYYQARGGDWAVILPYSAQIGLVGDLLSKRLRDDTDVARRVATVDSFQGGEHDTILFGFTRSNAKGDIGFFDDVRRSNVAFSRAKHRLILVGDAGTLLNATHPPFRDMTRALIDHVRDYGDLRAASEVMTQLAGETFR